MTELSVSLLSVKQWLSPLVVAQSPGVSRVVVPSTTEEERAHAQSHIHTHVHMHARMHTHVHMHARMHTHVHMHARMHTLPSLEHSTCICCVQTLDSDNPRMVLCKLRIRPLHGKS